MGGAFEGDDAKNVLFENPGSKNHWITVNVEAKNVNRAGHGSRVRANVVDAGGKKRSIYAVIGSGATFGANSIQTELGLGAASSLESIEILWEKPGYPVTKFTGVGMDQFVLLKEEGSKVEIVTRNKFAFAKKAAGHEHHH
jgi:hypothetical protein